MGLETSPDALLRLVRAQQESQVPTPRVLSVDDFCFCRRRSYGAILIDLERRIPIDLLPDREAETFKKWRLPHPGVQIISRDRGGAFADVQIEGESCRFRNKYLPLFAPYYEKSSSLDHST
jgi:transposase